MTNNNLQVNVSVTPELNITTQITPNVDIIATVTSGGIGKSSYELWLDAGHAGSLDDYLNWLRHSTYIHNQGSADNVWIINHNLDKYPSVTIIDSADRVVIGDVLYNDTNTLTVSFAAGFSGKAYLN